MADINIKGVVNISASLKPNKKIKLIKNNTITKDMALGILNLLAGNYSNNISDINSYVPSIIRIGYGPNENFDNFTPPDFDRNSPTQGLNYLDINITNKIINSLDSQSNKMVMSIYSYITPNSINPGNYILELLLYNKNKNKLLSSINYENVNKIQIGTGVGYDIQWDIIISPGTNPEVEISEEL